MTVFQFLRNILNACFSPKKPGHEQENSSTMVIGPSTIKITHKHHFRNVINVSAPSDDKSCASSRPSLNDLFIPKSAVQMRKSVSCDHIYDLRKSIKHKEVVEIHIGEKAHGALKVLQQT